jgi:hypothetical protein
MRNYSLNTNDRKIDKYWHEKYIGRPWEAAPRPPESFNCGELLRYIHFHELGINTAIIEANAGILSECVDNMRPAIFGLEPLESNAHLKDFDCAFFARSKYEDHCGICVMTLDGPLILHCVQGAGVVLENENEAKARGFKEITWYRHRARA